MSEPIDNLMIKRDDTLLEGPPCVPRMLHPDRDSVDETLFPDHSAPSCFTQMVFLLNKSFLPSSFQFH